MEKMARLEAEGLVTPAGRKAFEAAQRGEDRHLQLRVARRPPSCRRSTRAQLRGDAAAREYFDGQAPWYRRTVTHWVVSAKKEETRLRRLAQLIEASAQGRRLRQFDRSASK